MLAVHIQLGTELCLWHKTGYQTRDQASKQLPYGPQSLGWPVRLCRLYQRRRRGCVERSSIPAGDFHLNL